MPDIDFSDVARPAAPPKTRAGFDAPVTSGYNDPRDSGKRIHHALDLAYAEGEPIAVNKPGRVTRRGEDARSGKFLFIDHGDGTTSSYSHLQDWDAAEGDEIVPGRPFARAGRTATKRSHLHFVVRRDGARVNPEETDIRPMRAGKAPAAHAVDFSDAAATVAEDGSRILSNPDAIKQYQRTGRHLGKFNNAANATAYAQALHEQQAKAYAGGSSWADASAAQDPDAQLAESLARSSAAVAPPQSVASRQIGRASLPADTPDQIPAVNPYGDRVEPTGEPGSVRVINEEREAQVKAQRKRVAAARHAVARAKRDVRAYRSKLKRAFPEQPEGRVLSDDPNVAEGREYGAHKMREGAGQGTQPGPDGFFSDFVGERGTSFRDPAARGERLGQLRNAVRETAERHHREQAELDRLLKGFNEATVRARISSEVDAEQRRNARLGNRGAGGYFTPEERERQIEDRLEKERDAFATRSAVQGMTLDEGRLREDVRRDLEGKWERAPELAPLSPKGRDAEVERVTRQFLDDFDYAKRATNPDEAIGALDSLRQRFRDNPLVLIPIESSIYDAANSLGAWAAKQRVDAGEGTEADRVTLAKHQALQAAHKTFWAGVTDNLIEQPAFWGEFALTGGAAATVEGAVEQGLKSAAKRALRGGPSRLLSAATARKIAETRGLQTVAAIASKTAATVASGSMRAGTVGIPRIAENYAENRIKGMDGPTAFVKSVLNQAGEYISESQGEVAELLPGVKKLQDVMSPVMRRLESAGYHGVAGEIFEERWKDLYDVATGLQSWDEVKQKWSDPRVWGTEAVAFAVPGVANAAVSRLTSTSGTGTGGSDGLASGGGPEAPHSPVPESPETLRAQFKSAQDAESPRVAVLVTPGERERPAPAGFTRLKLKEGSLLVNDAKARSLGLDSPEKIEAFVSENGFEPLIGKVSPVTDTSKGVALRTEDGRGVELSTSVVSDASAAESQAAEDLAQFPQAARQEVVPTREAVARRAEDVLYERAVEAVRKAGRGSTSVLQRELRIGYGDAAKLIDRMEAEGVVGPADGANPRKVLVNAKTQTAEAAASRESTSDVGARGDSGAPAPAGSDAVRGGGDVRVGAQDVSTSAVEYTKIEPVTAQVSRRPFKWKTSDGQVMRADAGDWRVVQPDGRVTSVKPSVFDKTYEPVEGEPGKFRKTAPTKARQLDRPVDIKTLEGPGHGEPGDYLVTGAEGEQYIVPRTEFEKLYRRVESGRATPTIDKYLGGERGVDFSDVAEPQKVKDETTKDTSAPVVRGVARPEEGTAQERQGVASGASPVGRGDGETTAAGLADDNADARDNDNNADTVSVIRHSDPNIDGGEIVGRTKAGRLKVKNNSGGISEVQDPRRTGNREAAVQRVRRGIVIEPRTDETRQPPRETNGQNYETKPISDVTAGQVRETERPGAVEETTGAEAERERVPRSLEDARTVAEVDAYVNFHRSSPGRQTMDAETWGKRMKALGMQAAARKRQLAGELTAKEQKRAIKREAGNYIGKAVSVGGRNATVKANPFGNITVEFENGERRTVEASEVAPPVEAQNVFPAHEEIRRAVESADASAEPTFRAFPEGMGDSNIPRSAMPQVKGEHRGAMVQFLKGRGIIHERKEVRADSLKPSQADYSPEKVKKAQGFEGPARALLVSSDGHVADGHHQWLSKVAADPSQTIPVIELKAPIQQLLLEMARFPSSGVDDASDSTPVKSTGDAAGARPEAEAEEPGGVPAARRSDREVAERVRARIEEEQQPTVAQARASVKKERVDPKTGLTDTQGEWLAGALEDYAKEHYIDTNDYPRGSEDASPVELLEHIGKINSRPPYAEAGKPETFDVPGDGSFTVNNVAAANRLHQKITGKAIEGLPREQNATVRVGTPQRRNPPSTASQTGSIALYGHPVEALEALRPQRAQIEQLIDEAKDAKEKAEHQKTLSALDSEISHLESIKDEPGHLSKEEPLTPLGKAKRAAQLARERALVERKTAAQRTAARLDKQYLDRGDYRPSKTEVNAAVKDAARRSANKRKEFAQGSDAHVEAAREEVRDAIVRGEMGGSADVDSQVERVRETVARAIASSNRMSRWYEKGERPDVTAIEKRIDKAKDWEASKRARAELQDAHAYLSFMPKESGGPLKMARAERITETPEFKRWFEDSKVVDESGRPLVVYHGTNKDFARFEDSPARHPLSKELTDNEIGVFTTDSPSVAGAFAGNDEGANVMPLYVSIKNPLELGHFGSRVARPSDGMIALLQGIRANGGARAWREHLISQGVDGIVLRNAKEGTGDAFGLLRDFDSQGTVYIAFHPEQLKSATGNRGTFDANDPNVLRMARTDSDLHSVENAADLAPHVTVRRDGDRLTVNAHGAEILRRATAPDLDSLPAQGGFYELFVEPAQARDISRVLEETASDLRSEEFGRDEEAAGPLAELARELKAAAGRGGVVITEDAPPAAEPHGYLHAGSYRGAQGRTLDERHLPGSLLELYDEPAARAWVARYGGMPEYGNADPALVVEETMARLAGGEHEELGLTPEEAAGFMRRWYDSYVERNGVESLEEFERQRDEVKQIIEEAKARARDNAAEERPGGEGVRGLPGEQGEVAGGAGKGARGAPERAKEGELRERSLPATLREQGFRAADDLYRVHADRAAAEDAKALLREHGLEGSIALLKSTERPGAEHVLLFKIVSRALQDTAAQIAEANPEDATLLVETQRELTRDVAERFTRAGEFIRAAQLLEDSVEGLGAAAERLAKKRGKPLTDKERARIKRKGERQESASSVEQAEASEVARLKRLARSLRERVRRREKRLEELPEVARPPKPPPAERVRQSAHAIIAADAEALKAQIKASLGMGGGPLMMSRAEEDTRTRSPIRWVGGKGQFIPVLRRLFEPYKDRRLVEPFFGSGTVTFGLKPRRALVNDANNVLAAFHRGVAATMEYDLPYKSTPEDFARARDRYNALLNADKGDTEEAAKLFYYLNQFGHGGLYRVNSRGEFNTPFQADRAGKPLRSLVPYRGQYKGVRIRSGDFERLKIRESDFIYSDPPYDSEFAAYQKGGFSWDDQVRHAEWLARQTVPVVTQNEATPRILELYRKLGFDVWEIPARRSISRDVSNRGVGSAMEMIAFKNTSGRHVQRSLEGTGARRYAKPATDYIPATDHSIERYTRNLGFGVRRKVPVADIKIDKSRMAYANEVSAENVDWMAENFDREIFDPVTLDGEGYLLDGQHRLTLAKRKGLRYIDAVVDPGTKRPLMMARVADDISEQQVADLARYGSLLLLEQKPSRSPERAELVKAWRERMSREFGARIEPHLDDIHARAVRLKRNALAQARYSRLVEKLAKENPGLERLELEDLANEEMQSRRLRRVAFAEHNRLAAKTESARPARISEREARSEARKIRQLEKRVAALQVKLAAGDTSVAAKSTGTASREVSALRAELKDLNRELSKLRRERSRKPSALAEAIGSLASSEEQARGAVFLSQPGATPRAFADWLKTEYPGMPVKEAFKDAARLLEAARRAVQSGKDVRGALLKEKASLAGTELDRALVRYQNARADNMRARQDVARELKALKRGRFRTVAGEVLDAPKSIFISTMASADVSGIGRQDLPLAVMHPSAAPDFVKETFKGYLDTPAAKNIDYVENHADFPLAVRAGVNFSTAGGRGEGEEFFRGGRYLEKIPIIKQTLGEVVRRSDQSFGGGMDRIRLETFSAWAGALRAKGKTWKDDPEDFRTIARAVNVFGGRGDIGPHNAQATKALQALLGVLSFAPRYRMSRLQMSTLPLNPSFLTAPAASRRIVYKNYLKWRGALALALGLGALFGLVDWDDPDDSSWGKAKVGNVKIDVTSGVGLQDRLLARMAMEAYRGMSGQVTGKMAAEQEGRLASRWVNSGLRPDLSLARDWWTGEDFEGKPFRWGGWDGALASRMLPLGVSQTAQAVSKGSAKDVAVGFGAEFFGFGSNVYREREDAPQTRGEKLAARYVSERARGGKPLDPDTREKLDELKARARRGEDVSAELRPLVESEVITRDRADSIENAKGQTFLQEKFRQLSLDDALLVLDYLTPEEKRSVAGIIRAKQLNKVEAEAKTKKHLEEEREFEKQKNELMKTDPKAASELESPAEKKRRRNLHDADRARRRKELRYGEQMPKLDFSDVARPAP